VARPRPALRSAGGPEGTYGGGGGGGGGAGDYIPQVRGYPGAGGGGGSSLVPTGGTVAASDVAGNGIVTLSYDPAAQTDCPTPSSTTTTTPAAPAAKAVEATAAFTG